ncbi:hypothetical protein SmJEL517_g03266 [Synchytrium microbalum]|uniref:Zinc finger PHD-type domain-containing protein n=1 Tax=Synchytrium microbalum TaxID=1806994 RepID=A0A507BYZ2_9FUNG|nr:uncharacterized protein SmJEL517_g03266 [Synchytrium microbalum]TPX34017.1 hypothetical protein SmJEL517_g03266 [Synchytrium microbalum]
MSSLVSESTWFVQTHGTNGKHDLWHGQTKSREMLPPIQETGDLMIFCDSCQVWQHALCVGITDAKQVPKNYYCEQCKPENHRAKQQPQAPPPPAPAPALLQPTRSGRIRRLATPLAVNMESDPLPPRRNERSQRKEKAPPKEQPAAMIEKPEKVEKVKLEKADKHEKAEKHSHAEPIQKESSKSHSASSASAPPSRAPSPKRRNTMNSREAAQWNTADILPLLTPGASISEEAFNTATMAASINIPVPTTQSAPNSVKKKRKSAKSDEGSRADDEASGERSSSNGTPTPMDTPVMSKTHLEDDSHESSPAVTPKSERTSGRGGRPAGGGKKKKAQPKKKPSAVIAELDMDTPDETNTEEVPEEPDLASDPMGPSPTKSNASDAREGLNVYDDQDEEMRDVDGADNGWDLADELPPSRGSKRDRELHDDDDYASDVKPSKRTKRATEAKKAKATAARRNSLTEDSMASPPQSLTGASNRRVKETARNNRNPSPYPPPSRVTAAASNTNSNAQRQNTPVIHRDPTPPAKARPVHYRASVREMNNRVTHISDYIKRLSAQWIERPITPTPAVVSVNTKSVMPVDVGVVGGGLAASPVSMAKHEDKAVEYVLHASVVAARTLDSMMDVCTPKNMVDDTVLRNGSISSSMQQNGSVGGGSQHDDSADLPPVLSLIESAANQKSNGKLPNGSNNGLAFSPMLTPFLIHGDENTVDMMDKLNKQLEAFRGKYGKLLNIEKTISSSGNSSSSNWNNNKAGANKLVNGEGKL